MIEGFFGKPWDFDIREQYADFLAQTGYDFYIYAPKKDPFLRRRWQEPWPEDTLKSLHQLRQVYRRQGVQFGMGLSPFELYQEPSHVARQKLAQKLDALKAFELDILGLLFDDMRGDMPDLARRQVDLVEVVREKLPDTRLIFCPTYYSFDPILDQVFGERPAQYLEDLGTDLASEVDVFWTGPQVCSRTYPEAHLNAVTALLRRKPFLWDNYPVNDGKKISRFLHLRGFDHDTSLLRQHLAGHAVNPMNQPLLSYIPLSTLPLNYGAHPVGNSEGDYRAHRAFKKALDRYCEPEVASALAEDVALLQDQGLDEMGESQRQRLLDRYRGFNSPFAQEVADFLAGVYTFDPACLTD